MVDRAAGGQEWKRAGILQAIPPVTYLPPWTGRLSSIRSVGVTPLKSGRYVDAGCAGRQSFWTTRPLIVRSFGR